MRKLLVAAVVVCVARWAVLMTAAYVENRGAPHRKGGRSRPSVTS